MKSQRIRPDEIHQPLPLSAVDHDDGTTWLVPYDYSDDEDDRERFIEVRSGFVDLEGME